MDIDLDRADMSVEHGAGGQAQADYARLGAEICRLARVAAAMHQAQAAAQAREAEYDETRTAQNVRDQATRLRLAMAGRCA
ncbi:MAG: hypothetical protein MUE97_05715 [Phycisphaerales bacterium]|nr:hypothetical protein [Phycisphaerales bacterium]